MTINLPDDLERFIRAEIHSGHFASEEDAIAEAGLEVIQSQACYEGRYWNTTGIGRHVIVAGMVKAMRERKIKILSHGATGRGNTTRATWRPSRTVHDCGTRSQAAANGVR